MQKNQLSIIIPAYNEETRLPPTIKKTLQWADQTTLFDVELIIVDDGSGDRTCDLVREFAIKDSRVRLIEETHVGAMHAIIAGFQAAKYSFVGNMDADCAVHPREYERLLPFVHETGIAQGSRVLRSGLQPVVKSLFRKFLSLNFFILSRCAFKNQVKDPQIGFRLFKKESVLKIIPTLRLWHDGLKHGEIVFRAYGLGMTVTEIPVLYIHNEDSRCLPRGKVRAAFIALEAAAALISLWFQCSMDYQLGRLKRSVTRGSYLVWPFTLFSAKDRKINHKFVH
jgi:dolichyl-phosphate beta-glucosyltransferase